ncbi:hypothetical protein ACQB6R_02820 [Propionibacteriaceae bacterium G1746]|uniref:hypothetical protein n=1 Tax=Aestuariimicrobium sp. G57 TaxID=3418485 RepID=UPI003C148DD0
MGDFKIAVEALVKEEAYLRDMGEAQASLSEAIVGMPGQVPNWGPWGSLQPHITSAFNQFNETVSSSRQALNEVADLIAQTRMDYVNTENALTVNVEGP